MHKHTYMITYDGLKIKYTYVVLKIGNKNTNVKYY